MLTQASIGRDKCKNGCKQIQLLEIGGITAAALLAVIFRDA